MKKNLAVVVIFYICGFVGADETFQSKWINIGDFVISNSRLALAIDDDISSIDESYDIGNPIDVIENSSSCQCDILIYETNDLNIQVLRGWSTITRILILSHEFQTARGIGIGCSQDEVFSVYRIRNFQPFENGFIALFPMEEEESGYRYSLYLYFAITDGYVSSIELGSTVD